MAGAPITLEVALDASRLERREFSTGFKALRLERFVRATGVHPADTVEPYHDRIRETVVAHLDPEGRTRHHRRLARALEAFGNPSPEELVVHWEAAGERDQAARWAARAGDRALESLAFDWAAWFYERATQSESLGDDERHALQVKLGHALANAGRAPAAAAAYREALATAREHEARDLKRRIIEQLLFSGHFGEGLEATRDYLENLGLPQASSGLRGIGNLAVLRGRLALRGTAFRRKEERSIPEIELERIDACWALCRGFSTHDVVRGQVFQSRGALLALKAGEPKRVARALAMEYVNCCIDRPDSMTKHEHLLREAERIAVETDEPRLRALLLFVRGMASWAGQTRWKEAVGPFIEADGLFRSECTDVTWELNQCEGGTLDSFVWLGRWKEHGRMCTRVWRAGAERGDLWQSENTRAQQGVFAALVADDLEAAASHVDDEHAESEGPVYEFGRLRGEAYLRLYRDGGRDALAFLDANPLPLVSKLLLRVPLIHFLYHELLSRLAIAAAAQTPPGDRGSAIRRARRELEVFRGGQASAAPAVARLHGAGLAALGGDRERALPELEAAERALDELGLVGLVTVARWQRGELVGGDEGAELVRRARSWMRRESVVAPERIVRYLAPGFGA